MPVPIIGQSYSVLCWYPTALVKCECQKDVLTLIIVTGVGAHAICGQCGNHYWIEGFKMGVNGLEAVIRMGMPNTTKGAPH